MQKNNTTNNELTQTRRLWKEHTTGLIVVFSIILAAAGCQYAPKCLEPYDVSLHVRFVTMEGLQEKDTLLDSADVWGIGHEDSILTSGKSSFSMINLPLDPNRDSCRFVFRYHNLSDTLLFSYNRKMRLLSYECGYIMEYIILQAEYTHNQIDSIAITDSLVTNTTDKNAENIKIYLSNGH